MIELEVLKILRAVLDTGEPFEPDDWKAVFEQMKKQSVAAKILSTVR